MIKMKNQDKKAEFAIDQTGMMILMVIIIAILVTVMIILGTKGQGLLKWMEGLLR
jgi:hypothetical protein